MLSLLMIIGACMSSTDEPQSYDQLPDLYKQGVTLAREHLLLYGTFPYHLLFYKSLNMSEVETGFGGKYIYYNFYLKATTCAKDIMHPNPKRCPFRNDKKRIDCAVCYYKTFSGEVQRIPTPHVSCAHEQIMKQEITDQRREFCTKIIEDHRLYVSSLLEKLLGTNKTGLHDNVGSQD